MRIRPGRKPRQRHAGVPDQEPAFVRPDNNQVVSTMTWPEPGTCGPARSGMVWFKGVLPLATPKASAFPAQVPANADASPSIRAA